MDQYLETYWFISPFSLVLSLPLMVASMVVAVLAASTVVGELQSLEVSP